MMDGPPRKPGRPRLPQAMRRVNLYLDSASLAIARRLGNGNTSAGIRLALAEIHKRSIRK